MGSTKTGIDMNSVELLGHIIKDIAHATADNDSYGCVKFVAFCNAPDDNPFMAGGFHGVTEGDAVINVGVSGPGVVSRALDEAKGKDFDPETMNAVMHIEDESFGENEVSQVFQAGFELNGKVLRHAIVQVAN